MEITPDRIILWQWPGWEFIHINATIAYTWGIMVFMTAGSWLITRRLSTGVEISRWQNLLEVVVTGIREQIKEISHQDPGKYLSFIGTLFLFIAVANALTILPWYTPPTGSLSTTAGLAGSVFIAVPVYGIMERGVLGYMKNYIRPTPVMLPFNIIGELSRTLALAVRLFGNIMSGTIILGIIVSITPIIFPIVMRALGLLTGLIQAYIFGVLATVYIASATRAFRKTEEKARREEEKEQEKMKGG